MRRYRLATKREAVNLALRKLAENEDSSVKPATLEEALSLQGSGWDGDLDEMRRSRVPWC